MKLSLINCDIKEIHKKALNAEGQYFSKWNKKYKDQGFSEYEVI